MSVAVPVEETSGVVAARRAAVDLANQCGFNEADAGRVALVATEAATNMVRHAGRGEVVASLVERAGRWGVQLLALDSGRGMRDIARCLQDGYSTAGSSGTGLGAIQRLSSEARFYSLPGKGTVVLSRIWPGNPPPNGDLDWGSVTVPLRGEEVSGDSCSVRMARDEVSIVVADGLGHGSGAAEASRLAVQIFERDPFLPQPELMELLHGALRSTRGAAVALLRFSLNGRKVCFTGVGNVAGSVVSSAGVRHMISQPGTVGAGMRRLQPFSYDWPEDGLLLMYSDGVVSHWSLDPFPDLLRQDTAIIAGIIYRDFSRRRDDTTVLAVRGRPQ